jgi:hypothetical protein
LHVPTPADLQLVASLQVPEVQLSVDPVVPLLVAEQGTDSHVPVSAQLHCHPVVVVVGEELLIPVGQRLSVGMVENVLPLEEPQVQGAAKTCSVIKNPPPKTITIIKNNFILFCIFFYFKIFNM